MKLLRISASLLAFSMFTALAACGGGGGGGSVTPPGGGGGGTPPPTPTPTPTIMPTNPPGGGTIQSNGTIARIYDGSTSPLIFGKDGWQKNGSSSSDAADGDIAGGFATSGGQSSYGGVACNLGSEAMLGSSSYHVHTFLGLFVNGTQYAIPDAIGMQNPTSDEPVSNFSQACYIHTHAPSGIIHVEDPTASQSFTAQPSQFNLQSLLDIWGYGSLANLSAALGGSGSASIYVGTPCPNNTVGCANPQQNPNGNREDLVTSYTLQTGQPSSVLFGHHVAVWIIIGSMPSAGLPAIDFGISN